MVPFQTLPMSGRSVGCDNMTRLVPEPHVGIHDESGVKPEAGARNMFELNDIHGGRCDPRLPLDCHRLGKLVNQDLLESSMNNVAV